MLVQVSSDWICEQSQNLYFVRSSIRSEMLTTKTQNLNLVIIEYLKFVLLCVGTLFPEFSFFSNRLPYLMSFACFIH